MGEALRNVVQCLTFAQEDVDDCVFSDASKLGVFGDTGLLALRLGADGLYPTDADLYVQTRAIEPDLVTRWIGFDVRGYSIPEQTLTGALGTVGFRLDDGTGARYWDGAAWAAAGPGDWSTLDEVRANISSFPVDEASLSVLVNLTSSDGTRTPTMGSVLVAYEVRRRSDFEEYVVRTVIPYIRDSVRATTDIRLDWGGGATFDLGDVEFEDTIEIADVLAVYDLDTDPEMRDNLIQSYVSGVITATRAIDAGAANVQILASFVPVVALQTHSEYIETGHHPAVVFRDVDEMVDYNTEQEDIILLGSGPEALVVVSPMQVTYRIPIDVYANRSVEAHRLMEGIERRVRSNRVVYSPGLGLKVRLDIDSGSGYYPRAGEEQILRCTRDLRVFAERWAFDTRSGHGIMTMNTDLTE